MSIVTKQGDGGKTRLFTGEEVSKGDLRIEACGALDELVSAIGFASALSIDQLVKGDLRREQEALLRLGTILSSKSQQDKVLLGDGDVARVEERIAFYESRVELGKGFVIPGKTASSAAIHLARCIARRMERRIVALLDSGGWVPHSALIYSNRISDLLFLMAVYEEEGGVVLAISTAGSDEEATSIARRLVEEGLASCVNIAKGVRSIYRWKGDVEDSSENLLFIKAKARDLDVLKARLKELHSYECPELIVLGVSGGLEDYLRWVMGSGDGN